MVHNSNSDIFLLIIRTLSGMTLFIRSACMGAEGQFNPLLRKTRSPHCICSHALIRMHMSVFIPMTSFQTLSKKSYVMHVLSHIGFILILLRSFALCIVEFLSFG